MKMLSDHFSARELACKCGCKRYALEDGFIEALERLRVAYGYPMPVTSCCRCTAHNKAVGGHPRSLHMMSNPHHKVRTLAIDIRLPAGPRLHKLIELATADQWAVGLNPAEGFVHLDLRTDVGLKPVIFFY